MNKTLNIKFEVVSKKNFPKKLLNKDREIIVRQQIGTNKWLRLFADGYGALAIRSYSSIASPTKLVYLKVKNDR